MAAPEPPRQRQNFLGGFKLTLEHLGRPPVTRQYPEEKRPKQPRQHGRHVLNRYEDGMEKCIGCELCAGVCPADCIYVRGLDNPPDHPVSPGERYGYVYEINFLRCIHCDLCVEACPTEAITESKLMEFSFTNRNDAIYTKEELLVDDDGKPQHLPWEDWREGDDLHTSGWMRATSPSGAAEFEGQVQWSGELGFGVRVARGRPVRPPRRRHHREPAAARHPRAPPRHRRPAGRQAGSAGGHRPHAGEGGAVRPRGRQEAPGPRPTPTTPPPWWPATPSGTSRAPPPAPAGGPGGSAAAPSTGTSGDLMVGIARGGGHCGGDDGHPRLVGRRRHVRGRRRHRAGRGHRGGGGPQPGALRPHAGDDPVRRGRAVRPAAGQLPGRRAGDRLRRCHRRALPVRHHVPRRRPRGEHRRRAASGPAPAGHRTDRARHHRPPAAGPGVQVDDRCAARGRTRHRPAVQRQPAGQVGVHHLPVPLRGHRGPADHRRGRGGGAGPAAAGHGRPRWTTGREPEETAETTVRPGEAPTHGGAVRPEEPPRPAADRRRRRAGATAEEAQQ